MVARGSGDGQAVHRRSTSPGNPQQATIKNVNLPSMEKDLPQQLIRPDIACHSLWSSHTPLVSEYILDTAVIKGYSVNSHTPRKQGMGLGLVLFVILQQRLHP